MNVHTPDANIPQSSATINQEHFWFVRKQEKCKMSTCMQELSLPRKRLAKIRCVHDCIECFRSNTSLPKAICYVPAEVEYKVDRNAKVTLYSEPSSKQKQGDKVSELSCVAGAKVIASGEDYCNSQGQWICIIKV